MRKIFYKYFANLNMITIIIIEIIIIIIAKGGGQAGEGGGGGTGRKKFVVTQIFCKSEHDYNHVQICNNLSSISKY